MTGSVEPKGITNLRGVGPQIAAKLARLHIHTISDVLFHLPHRYEDRTSVTPLGALLPDLNVVVQGEIELSQVTYGRRRSLLVRISDGTGSLIIRLFHFSRAQQTSFTRGSWLRCFGQCRRGQNGYEMIHPEYRIFLDQPEGGLEATLTPIYPTTEGLSQTFWRKITDQVLQQELPKVKELLSEACLPKSLKASHTSMSLSAALLHLHRPPAGVELQNMLEAQSLAHQRLIYEELLAHHFSLRSARLAREAEKASPLKDNPKLAAKLNTGFGFTLTAAQQRVVEETTSDLATSVPMLRLVQGDVGSGKTVVAAHALLSAAANHTQAVLMAPTELLAEQHHKTLSAWFAPLGFEVGWLASKTAAKQKRETLERLASGELLIAVGTHALIQEAVQYHSLSLVVIDEQHRFGVDQRMALRAKTPAGLAPHQLTMTATPIPRTLAMSFYADLDVSSIDELPPGRVPVETVVMSAESKRGEVIERVRLACAQGRQVYWVCPLIDESEAIFAKSAIDTEKELVQFLKPHSVALVHGRMKAKQKEQVMQAFRDGECQVLVATTVIEVGVDVPNASLMIIENAERMGLAQLHQLRGRVGRGSQKSYCILLYQPPLGEHAKQRLQTLRETNDGFVIAEQDLKMRGAGELLGTKQTGSLSFKVADIIRDQHFLSLLNDGAQRVIKLHPENIDTLVSRWVGTREVYMNA